MKKSKNSHMVSRLHPRNKPIFPPISPMMEKEELPLRILYKPTNTADRDKYNSIISSHQIMSCCHMPAAVSASHIPRT